MASIVMQLLEMIPMLGRGILNRVDDAYITTRMTFVRKSQCVTINSNDPDHAYMTVCHDLGLVKFGNFSGYNCWRFAYTGNANNIVMHKGIDCIMNQGPKHRRSRTWFPHLQKEIRRKIAEDAERMLLK